MTVYTLILAATIAQCSVVAGVQSCSVAQVQVQTYAPAAVVQQHVYAAPVQAVAVQAYAQPVRVVQRVVQVPSLSVQSYGSVASNVVVRQRAVAAPRRRLLGRLFGSRSVTKTKTVTRSR